MATKTEEAGIEACNNADSLNGRRLIPAKDDDDVSHGPTPPDPTQHGQLRPKTVLFDWRSNFLRVGIIFRKNGFDMISCVVTVVGFLVLLDSVSCWILFKGFHDFVGVRVLLDFISRWISCSV